ncbi:hypothetical protein G7075_14695 [Phycicoccus sp. HDW14]|uniref:sunset domain-containing protein n=1 Tax=Phycicoccus sp. HDW14 TaxID=2714941 RepID=UPI00140D0817|nr:hypothetical protein [Phycicoccus sp. HDW14]QIM22090.1 hypothetical protein G7075_14695 [Phycicoccus sp. HDW14]
MSEESPAVEEPVAEDVVVEEPGADESTPVEAPEQEPAAQDPQSEERSARIAAATDFRDGDTGDDAEEEPYVWGASRAGTGEHMDEQPEVDDTTPTAATDAAAPPGEWGGPHASDEGSPSDDTPSDDAADESPADAAAADEAATDEAATDEVAEGSEVAEDPGPGAFTEPEEPAAHEAEAYDPTPERDWSADEGELLAETGDRADELAAEREQMDRDAAAVGMEPVHPEVVERAEEQETADEPVEVQEPADEPVEEQAPAEPETSSTDEGDAPADHTDEEPAATSPRRVSEFHEIRDGGYGMGSAAAIDDGAQPMDHPVQAYRDTMTYRLPGDAGYDEATADVWFYDQGAAERSGFHRSEG